MKMHKIIPLKSLQIITHVAIITYPSKLKYKIKLINQFKIWDMIKAFNLATNHKSQNFFYSSHLHPTCTCSSDQEIVSVISFFCIRFNAFDTMNISEKCNFWYWIQDLIKSTQWISQKNVILSIEFFLFCIRFNDFVWSIELLLLVIIDPINQLAVLTNDHTMLMRCFHLSTWPADSFIWSTITKIKNSSIFKFYQTNNVIFSWQFFFW